MNLPKFKVGDIIKVCNKLYYIKAVDTLYADSPAYYIYFLDYEQDFWLTEDSIERPSLLEEMLYRVREMLNTCNQAKFRE